MDSTKDLERLDEVVRSIYEAYPLRAPTSDEERLAQQLVSGYFEELGIESELHPFSFPWTVHGNFAWHFGLGTLGTAISPLAPKLAFLLHAGTAASYLMDTSRRIYGLRRLLRFKPSQNLVATLAAEGQVKFRVVFAAHIDSAYTGWIFDPRLVKLFATAGKMPGAGMKQPVRTAVMAQGVLAAIDLLRAVAGPATLWLRPVEWFLTVPSALTLLFNAQILLNNKVVPGANDDLSGVAAMVVLAQRFAKARPKNVEFVFAVTGCEEAGLGGADALARNNPCHWDKRNTAVIALDTISSGKLHYLHPEGETFALEVASWIRRCLGSVTQEHPRFGQVEPFVATVGGTDAAAFMAHGWDAVALTRIDPSIGAARHYHCPTDTPDNLNFDEILEATDFAELLARQMVAERLGGQGVR